jgi:UDP-GlcNAc:undecaprenyl-phosphate GlcNAc-1-phosphate transferase
MISVIVAFVLAIAVAASLTPIVCRVALHLGAVDAPAARRVHTRAVPRLGGIAIVIAFYLPLAALFALDSSSARQLFASPRVVAGIAAGGLLVAGIGLWDDVAGVGAKRKLLFQSLAACIAFAGGLRIQGITLPILGSLEFGWLALPVTIVWIVGIINALNLIDGLDGLAGGIAFFACVTNFIVGQLGGNVLTCLVCATLAGAILGFLIYNFNPAKIFMGDCGSMFLGFILACAALLGAGTQKSPTIIAILVPLLAMGLPVMDMLFAIARRFLERRSIFAADRGHIHHRLLDIGITHRRAVMILYGLSLTLTLLALAVHIGRWWQVGAALLFLCVVVLGAVRFLGHFRMSLIARMNDGFTQKLRRGVPTVLPQIRSARSPDEVLRILERFAGEHGLLALSFEPAAVDGSLPTVRWELPNDESAGRREPADARFTITERDGAVAELCFVVDMVGATLAPQAAILLQLVADAAESALRRAPTVSTAPSPMTSTSLPPSPLSGSALTGT